MTELQLEEGDEIVRTEMGPTSCPCRIPCIVVFLSICLTLAVIALIMVTGLHSHSVVRLADVKERCSNPGLVQNSAGIISRMDLDSTPCNNFYDYACGGFVQSNIVPPGSPPKTTMRDVQHTYYVRLYRLLRDTVNKDWQDYPRQLLKTCLNSARSGTNFQLSSLDIAEYQSLLGLDNSQSWTTEEMIATTSSPHLSTFVSISGAVNDKNTPVEDLSGVSIESALDNYIFLKLDNTDLAVGQVLDLLLDSDSEKASIVRYLNDLQRQLLSINNTSSNTKTCESWEKASEIFKEQAIVNLEDLLTPLFKSENSAKTEDFLLKVKQRKVCYSEKAVNLIKLLKEQKIKDISKIALLNAIIRSSRLLGQGLGSWYRLQKGRKDIKGFIDPNTVAPLMASGDEALWQRCIGLLDHTMRPIIAPMYAKDYLPKSDIKDLKVIIGTIKDGFKLNVDQMDWLNSKEKAAVYGKIDNMLLNIAYPPIFDDSSFSSNAYLNQLVLFKGTKGNALFTYLSSYRLHHRYTVQASIAKTSGDWLELEIDPSQPTSLFFDLTNDVLFPQNILQRPFYDPQARAFLNYGGIGFIAGHEILHAFDPNGHHVKSTSRSNESLWAVKSSAEKTYHTRMGQIDAFYVDLLSKEMPSVKSRSKSWLANDIADMGGLKAALTGYRNSMEYSAGKFTIAGLKDFSKEQLFFLNYAQMFCSASDPDSLKPQRDLGHSPDKIRVLGTLMNSKDFAEAYSCAAGDKMNPSTKYSLW